MSWHMMLPGCRTASTFSMQQGMHYFWRAKTDRRANNWSRCLVVPFGCDGRRTENCFGSPCLIRRLETLRSGNIAHQAASCAACSMDGAGLLPNVAEAGRRTERYTSSVPHMTGQQISGRCVGEISTEILKS